MLQYFISTCLNNMLASNW